MQASAARAAQPGFDIFCRVIDNFGDIGVCWRLAKCLSNAPDRPGVRLWVDDLRSFAKIEPSVDPGLGRQIVNTIELIHWTAETPALAPLQNVIEAFACSPPAEFISRMVENDCLWINLEYLSAEPWVESCHALPSLQPNGLRKYFYFPGFTPATGGLLRETQLLHERDHWRADPTRRQQLLRHAGVSQPLIDGLMNGWRQIYLFCYPTAPVLGLLHALQSAPQPSVVLVPESLLRSLGHLQTPNVHIVPVPFVNQDEFDQMLWSSDLNFVRGEDSLIRAIWAGRPFVWQIYEQQDDAHLEKLRSWLALCPFDATVQGLMLAWNTRNEVGVQRALQLALQHDHGARWRAAAQHWADTLAAQHELSHSLMAFCTEKHGTG